MSIETNGTFVDYMQAQQLDPLDLDAEFAKLPHYNKTTDTENIGRLLCAAAECSLDLDPHSNETSLAAMRDLDFLASSLVAHGVEPMKLSQAVEPAFSQLGSRLDTVPRGTVYTYTVANPPQPRRRSFTGDPQEELFVQAVTDATITLDTAVEAFATSGPHAGVAGFTMAANTLLTRVIEVKRNVTPEFFTGVLRPYLDPLTVDNVEYFGPGGVQQSLAIDYLLWGHGDTDAVYSEFVKDNYKYLSPQQRSHIEKSLLDLGSQNVLAYLSENADPELAAATHGVLRTLRKFRYPHKRLAEDNAALAPEEDTYASAILPVLIRKTEGAINEIETRYNLSTR